MNLLEVGEIIRKIRKDKGYRLEDVADEKISSATISNIERGIPHVHRDKIQYVMEKLGIHAETIPELLEDEQSQHHQTEERLQTLEVLFRIGETDQAREQMQAMNLPDSHPSAPKAWQLIGKCDLLLGKHAKAERELLQSVRLAHASDQLEIEASSYNALSLIAFDQNDLEKALHQTEKGLHVLQDFPKKTVIYYILKRNQIIYLERLNQVTQALRIVNEVWPDLHQIPNLETVLSLYWSKSELLRRCELYEEALSVAKEGMYLAQSNYMLDSLFDQVTVIGSIYMEMEEWDWAQTYFDLALQFSGKVKKEKILSTVWTRLAQLHLMRNEAEEALSYLQLAIQKAEAFNDAPRLSDALLTMGDALWQNTQREQAIACYEKAANLCMQHQMIEKAQHAYFQLSQCWEGIDEQKFTQSLKQRYAIEKQLEIKKGRIP